MNVRNMSAQSSPISGLFRHIPETKLNRSKRNHAALISPKAEVRGSNPFGRANKISDFLISAQIGGRSGKHRVSTAA